jgi:ABC-type uncharacterized transport system permease subunit
MKLISTRETTFSIFHFDGAYIAIIGIQNIKGCFYCMILYAFLFNFLLFQTLISLLLQMIKENIREKKMRLY